MKKKGFLKGKKIVVYALSAVGLCLNCAAIGTFLGDIITSESENNRIYDDYKSSAIYHDLLEEDLQRVSDAYKNNEISLKEYGENMKNLGTEKQLKEYMQMDYEENKEFQSRLEKLDDSHMTRWSVGVGLMTLGWTADITGRVIRRRQAKKEMNADKNNEMDSAKGLEIGE